MNVFDRLEAQLADAHPHRSRRALPRPAPRTVVAFAAALAAVVVVAFAALAGDSTTEHAGPAAPAPAVDRAETTVAVLNSARTPGLARDAATALQRFGWKIGTVTNGPDQSLTTSCVDFVPGHSQAASTIARQLRIRNVLPVTKDLQVVAGPDADVVVVLGRDQIARGYAPPPAPAVELTFRAVHGSHGSGTARLELRGTRLTVVVRLRGLSDRAIHAVRLRGAPGVALFGLVAAGSAQHGEPHTFTTNIPANLKPYDTLEVVRARHGTPDGVVLTARVPSSVLG
jgi:hypothetical protein